MIRHLIALLFATILCPNLKAQDSLNTAPPQQKMYHFVEYPAEFPGGRDAMYAFISANLRYPEAAAQAHMQGSVRLSFTVKKNGRIDSVAVEKGAGFGMDEEAIRVIKAMPRWRPCRVNGVRVNSHYHIPLTFLDDNVLINKKIPA